MIHRTTGRSLRLNHSISEGVATPEIPHAWSQDAEYDNKNHLIPFSAKTVARDFSGMSHLLREFEEGGYAE